MKILVEEVDLNEAFELVSDLRNHITKDHPIWFKHQLQRACNILGPMWADGTDSRKILVEREFLKDCIHELNHNKRYGINNVMLVIQRLLKDNPDSSLDEDSINQQVSDNAWNFVQGNTPHDITDDDRRWADEAIQKHDDSQIPVRSKEANIQAIKDALAKDPGKISISPLPKGPPDPRCDGCEHQHPYAENLSYDIAAGKVYCNRGVTPTYYKEGRTIRYPPNLMICGVYYLEEGTLMKTEPRENTTYDFLENPDPRCNGCEFQHPFAELLSYDTTNQLVYCGRDTNPSYHSEGRRVRYPHGTEKPQGIRMCHIYYLDRGTLIKYGADSHLNTSEAFSKQTVELELNNKYVIVELLDMLIEHAKYHIEALGIDSKVFTMPLMFDAENLKNRLAGEK